MANAFVQLEEANHYIAEGEQRIFKQQARIAEMERSGHNASSSKEALRRIEEIVARMIRHRSCSWKRLQSSLKRR